jgi:peptidoglycan/xylan/chitin deacetylase (PgdA/CDA1 family)
MPETLRPRRIRRDAPLVLMYHYFGDPPGADPEKLFVREQTFTGQLEHLRRRGWRPLSLDGYLAALDGAPTPRRSYLLTIDDGHESAARVAPLLAEAGVPSVLFVCPGLLGDRARWSEAYPHEGLLSADQLKLLADAGMELGVHGWDHTRMSGMDDDTLVRHVAEARTALEAATAVRARAFAYPYGTHDASARRAVAAAGYRTAFAVAREHGRFAVDRVFVQSTDSPLAFRLKLSRGYRLLSRGAGRAWRLRHAVRAAVALVRRNPARAPTAPGPDKPRDSDPAPNGAVRHDVPPRGA